MLSSRILNVSSLRRFVAGVAVLGALGAPGLLSAQTTDFETLGYGPACNWGGGSAFSVLDGKKWNGFRPLDLDNLANSCHRSTNTGYSQLQSGYVGDVIAVGHDGAWLSSFSPFTLESMVAGAGWQNPTTLTLKFYLNTVLKSTQTISLNTYQTGAQTYTGFYTGPTDFIGFMPDYTGGTDEFNSLGESCAGVTGPCTPYLYESWFVDNMVFTPRTVVLVTPEPATFAMLGIGMAVVGFAARRRRRQ
ncbi:MAG: PEP-CTERM sorting domain-containing protein [Gemmatimonadaceae bacterium]